MKVSDFLAHRNLQKWRKAWGGFPDCLPSSRKSRKCLRIWVVMEKWGLNWEVSLMEKQLPTDGDGFVGNWDWKLLGCAFYRFLFDLDGHYYDYYGYNGIKTRITHDGSMGRLCIYLLIIAIQFDHNLAIHEGKYTKVTCIRHGSKKRWWWGSPS